MKKDMRLVQCTVNGKEVAEYVDVRESLFAHRYGTGAATPKVILTSSRTFFRGSILLTTLQLRVAISIAFRMEYLI